MSRFTVFLAVDPLRLNHSRRIGVSVNISSPARGGILVKSEQEHSQHGESDPLRWLRYAGAVAAFLAVLGIAIVVFWYVLRAPRF